VTPLLGFALESKSYQLFDNGVTFRGEQLPRDSQLAHAVHYSDGRTGRMILITDDSIFHNALIGAGAAQDPSTGGVQFANGNYEFMSQSIEWLKGGTERPRSNCLFVSNGRIIEQFAIEQPTPPLPNINWLALLDLFLSKMADPMIDRFVEQNDLINRVTDSVVKPNRAVRGLSVFASILLLIVLFRCFTKWSGKGGLTNLLPLKTLSKVFPKGSLNKQRLQSTVDIGNFTEAMRWRIRDRFAALGAEPDASGTMPPILIDDRMSNAEIMEAAIQRLWLLGYGSGHEVVTTRNWDELNTMLERCLNFAEKGRWSFGQMV
jgi:hypothetical protein